MRKSHGLTLLEAVIVLMIICVVAALSYPAFDSARKSSRRARCVSNLKQIGMALLQYREAHEGLSSGTPVEMGLPPRLDSLETDIWNLRCNGNNPKGNGYYTEMPGPWAKPESIANWTKYVSYYGEGAIIYFDPNHQNTFPRSMQWESWTVIGLRLDSSVTIRTRMGFPTRLQWWHY